MTLKSPARSALRIPYLAVRTPLGLLDEQVVVRVFGVDSTAHRSLRRGLHTLDSCAASVFAPAGDERGGTSTVTDEPADTTDADDLSPETVEPAPETVEPASEIITDVEPVDRDGGEQPIDSAEQQEIEQLAETFLADDELTPRSGELAENDELRRVQAEIRAKQEIETEHGQL